MSFSLRLTADLTIGLAARVLSGRNGHPLIAHVLPDGDTGSRDGENFCCSQLTEENYSELLETVSRLRSRFVWIAGSEPLEHPGIARFSNVLAASGRQVFLQTSGAELKRRLHEFQPSSRFWFALRFDAHQPSSDRRASDEGEFHIGREALRSARLSGFFTCAHLIFHPGTLSTDLERLHGELKPLDIDGILITSSATAPELAQQASALRRRLLRAPWGLFSRLVESAALPPASRNSEQITPPSLPDPQSESFGEEAQA
jgi:hypothetical protein